MTVTQRERFIPFNIGSTQHYIDKVTHRELSEEEFREIITSNYQRDKDAGYRDRMAGYYDKWYRYNRLDDGHAYDEGVKLAVSQDTCPEMLRIIPA